MPWYRKFFSFTYYELGNNLWCMRYVFKTHSTTALFWNSKVVSILNKEYENENKIEWEAFRQMLMRIIQYYSKNLVINSIDPFTGNFGQQQNT